MNRVIHFELHAPDAPAALKFYQDVFGWKVTKWEGGGQEYYLLTTGPDDAPGINGGLLPSRDGQPRTVNTIQVADVDAAAAKVLSAGGKVVVPKMPIPGVGWLCFCTDPGGLIFGIMHDDRSAK